LSMPQIMANEQGEFSPVFQLFLNHSDEKILQKIQEVNLFESLEHIGNSRSVISMIGKIERELVETEEKTASGIVLPDTAKEKPQEGKVVAVGTGRVLENGERVALEVADGDRIISSKYAGTEVKYEGKEYLILRENDILAIIG